MIVLFENTRVSKHQMSSTKLLDVLRIRFFLSQELQVFKVVELGEEDFGAPQFQVFCFLLPFAATDFISVDAMSKLRQVRTAL